jgi:hypothetical protein
MEVAYGDRTELMQLIEDVEQRDWWPYGGVEGTGRLSALWLPSRPDDERSLLDALRVAWGDLEWSALGTWYRKGREIPAKGFDNRYPSLSREMVARCELATPRGLVALSEWCILDPSSGLLHEFLTALRRARGKGSWLTVLPDRSALRTWYALSAGIAWRATLALEVDTAVDIEATHRLIISHYLAHTAGIDLVSIVPLDHHPWGGYVVAGNIERLTAMASCLPPAIAGLAQVEAADIFMAGGGLAL